MSMRLFVTALVFLGGLFMVLLALSFLFQPESTAAGIGIAATRTQGLSTLRGDMFGFFGIIGICMLWGAWKRKGDLLLVPAIIMVVVIIGRIVSATQDGTYDGYLVPMAIEALIAALLLLARSMLPHHTLEEVGD
jgi:nitrate reductase gamma subunit